MAEQDFNCCWICSGLHPPPPGYLYGPRIGARLPQAGDYSEASHAPLRNYYAAVSAESWHPDDCALFVAAGRTLDGRLHEDFPTVNL